MQHLQQVELPALLEMDLFISLLHDPDVFVQQLF